MVSRYEGDRRHRKARRNRDDANLVCAASDDWSGFLGFIPDIPYFPHTIITVLHWLYHFLEAHAP